MKKVIFISILVCLSACATMQEMRENYVNTHPGLTEEQRTAIVNGDIIAGMTQDMAIASWGSPVNTTQEVLRGHNVVNWFYKQYSGNFTNVYRLRFVNGSVQELKLVKSFQQRYPYAGRRHRHWRAHYREFVW